MITNQLTPDDRAEIISLIDTVIFKVSLLQEECKEIHLSIEELYSEVES